MLNTLFFAPVEADWINYQSYAQLPQEDPDNSLLEILMEDYLDAPESTTDPQDDTDHLSKKLEYISHTAIVWGSTPIRNLLAKPIKPQRLLVNPFLETLTPPPKHISACAYRYIS